MSDFWLGSLAITLGALLLALILRGLLAYLRLFPDTDFHGISFRDGYWFSPFFRNFDYLWLRFVFSPSAWIVLLLFISLQARGYSPSRLGEVMRKFHECQTAARSGGHSGWKFSFDRNGSDCRLPVTTCESKDLKN